MKVLGVTLLSGILMAFGSAPVLADEVDDLLAGKTVVTEDAASLGHQFESPSLQEQIVSPAESAKLPSGASWNATIKNVPEPAASESAEPAQPASEPTPPTDVSLVPEPSAIALGVAAILYFLIFFRRRHLP